MEISCDIIRDVLPLYAEDLVSADTRTMVDEHLCKCDPCTRQLGILKKAAQLPVEVETKSIKRVGDTIRRKRILAVLMALSLLGTLIFGALTFIDARIYLSADQAVEKVVAMEDGSVRIFLSDDAIGMGTSGDTATGNYGVIAFTNLNKRMSEKKRTPYSQLPEELKDVIDEEVYGSFRIELEGGAVNHNIWYIDPRDGTAETLLWDADNPYEGEPLIPNVNYHIAYYVAIMAVLCAGCILASRLLQKLWMKELAFRLAIVSGSMSLSTVIVTAGQFMELWGEFTEAVASGFCLAVPMTLTAICARQLNLLNRKEKGL